MAKLELSQDELAFSFLIDSHKIACKWLSEFALTAVKHNNPTAWKDKVCACFAAGVKRYVRERLENNLPLTDIYAVCKLIACQINDVAKFCGGDLLDPRKKERFSLQVQGVAMARNIAYHEEFVSVREVCSSIDLLTSLMESTRTRQRETTSVTEALNILSENVHANLCSESSGECSFSAGTIARALLYSSFIELKWRFSEYFKSSEGKAVTFGKHATEESGKNESDVSTLIKRIRAKIDHMRANELAKGRLGDPTVRYTKDDCFKLCKKILAARNVFAHSPQQSISEIRQALLDIKHILAVFCLSEVRISYSIERLERLQDCDNPEGHYSCVLKEEEIPTTSFYSPWHWGRQRILRPRSKNFVGRMQELSSLTSALMTERIVLIHGQAGVGKTFLATELAHRLTKIYPQQIWLTCTDSAELEKEIANPNKHFFFEDSSDTNNARLSSQNSYGVQDSRKHLRKLYVLDDVGSSTVSRICKQFLQNPHLCIVTTRSTAVKESLQRQHMSFFVVRLQPFSTIESVQLINAKLESSKLSLRLPIQSRFAVLQPLKYVLGNLPVCVSIYSSMLAFAAKKASISEVYGTLNDLLVQNWNVIEEQFGDRLHVRGLTGVIHSSENYLEEHPLIVLLLAKISSCKMESIPWEVLKQRGSPKWLIPAYILEKCHLQWSRKLFYELLGVSDWLFSPCAANTLNTCRDILEELGLISLDNSGATVRIHRLTLISVQEMLERRCHFLECLISTTAQKSVEDPEVKNALKLFCQCLSCEQQLQAFYRSIDLLEEVNRGIRDDELFARYYDIFVFLSESFTNLQLVEIKKLTTTPKVFGDWFSNVITSELYNFKVKSRLQFTPGEILSWSRHSQPLHEYLYKSNGWMNGFLKMRCLDLTFQLLAQDRLKESLFFFRQFLTVHGMYIQNDSYQQAVCHCLMARFLEVVCGREARKLYLWQAAQSCPILLKYPSVCDITALSRRTMARNREERDFVLPICEDSQYKFTIWSSLVGFQVTGCLERSGTIDEETLQVMLLLIKYCQQKQRLLEEEIQKMNDTGSQVGCTVRMFNYLSQCNPPSYTEAQLYDRLRKKGLSFRALMKTFYTTETLLHKVFIGIERSLSPKDFCSATEGLVLNVSTRGYRLGHFSVGIQLAKRFAQLYVLENQPSSLERVQNIDEESHEVPLSECYVKECFALFEGLWLLYVKKDFNGALRRFIAGLVFYINAEEQAQYIDPNGGLFYNLTLAHMKTVCYLLGQGVAVKIITELGDISKNERLINYPIVEMMKTTMEAGLSSQYQQSLLHTVAILFMKARAAYGQGFCIDTLEEALKCWRVIVSFTDDVNERLFDESFLILHSLLIDLAGFLKHVYCIANMYSTAEWFLKFRIDCAREANWHFLVSKHASEYVLFLKEREKWPEAQMWSDYFQQSIAEEFGDDLEEWLPDAPHFGAATDRTDATDVSLQRLENMPQEQT